jgi:hypothetical protein
MRSPRLSICIPTVHGRDACLEQTLDSIERQLDPETRPLVEVCISVCLFPLSRHLAGFRHAASCGVQALGEAPSSRFACSALIARV